MREGDFMAKLLTFCETTRFSKRLAKRLADDDYAKLQLYLAENPDAGALVEGGGGIRKVRFALPGRGKSGGIRVIYYWSVGRELILLLDIYAKNEQADLTDDQTNRLRREAKGFDRR
jgi:hypothetical protein